MPKHLIVYVLFLCCSISPLAMSQQTVQLINSDDVVRLTSHFNILIEKTEPLTLDQVRSKPEDFIWGVSQNPNYGYQQHGVWLHTTLSNVTDTQEWVVDLGYTQMDKVDFYLLIDGVLVNQSRQGKLRPNTGYRFPTVPVEMPYATTIDLYVRIESQTSSLIAPIDVQSKAHHAQEHFLDSLIWGLFYGGLLILGFYHLALFTLNKEKSQLAYVLFIASGVFWQFAWGGHIQVISPWSISPWLSVHIELIYVLITLAAGIFTFTFVNAEKKAPRTAPYIQGLLTITALLGLASLLNLLPALWQNGFIYLVCMLSITSFLIAGFEAYFNHFLAARYFIFGWSILSCCAVIAMLSLIDILPSNFFTAYCFQMGLFIQIGLFSLALMDKIKGQFEREIQQATKDLRNNMELIEEQNARLDIARKNAVKASHIKSQFLANMSHEIRTPLNAILGFSKELNQLSLPAEKQEQVRIINSAADSLLCIVNDVLDVSKIEAGKLEINNQPFSPNQLLEEMVSVMAKSAHQKKLEFIFELAPLPEKLIGDVLRIRQVLNNLLSNALKFTESGHICLNVSGNILDHGMFELNIKVEDTGIGINTQDRKKLFNAFSQIDDALSRSYQGTGLGLVICQQLVKLMRGKITFASTPGLGSCFEVTIRTNLLNTKNSLSHHSHWKGKSVCLYDPYPYSRTASSAMLTYLGAKVFSYDSLETLRDITTPFDYLFVTLPISKLMNRERVLTTLNSLAVNKRVILYSGPEPVISTIHNEFLEAHQLRMPLTLNKLDTLLNLPKQNEESELHQRLTRLPKAKVLAVDDMEMNLKLLKTWLTPSPLELTMAFSGEDAVALCKENEYDLILMDVQMPNIDGLQATKLIRSTELNIGTPIIAVTAHAFKEEQERLMSSGMDDFLSKPIDLSQLINLIEQWCHQEEHQPVSLPSLDWQLALTKSNQNDVAAKEMLEEFAKQLPTMIDEIESHRRQHDFSSLQASIHKLHGVSCYTGVPKLQSLCEEVETALKQEQIQTALERIPALITESELIISRAERMLTDLGDPTKSDFDIV